MTRSLRLMGCAAVVGTGLRACQVAPTEGLAAMFFVLAVAALWLLVDDLRGID